MDYSRSHRLIHVINTCERHEKYLTHSKLYIFLVF